MVKFHRSFCAQKLSFFGEVWYSGTEVENSVPHPSYEETDIKKSRDRKFKKITFLRIIVNLLVHFQKNWWWEKINWAWVYPGWSRDWQETQSKGTRLQPIWYLNRIPPYSYHYFFYNNKYECKNNVNCYCKYRSHFWSNNKCKTLR